MTRKRVGRRLRCRHHVDEMYSQREREKALWVRCWGVRPSSGKHGQGDPLGSTESERVKGGGAESEAPLGACARAYLVEVEGHEAVFVRVHGVEGFCGRNERFRRLWLVLHWEAAAAAAALTEHGLQPDQAGDEVVEVHGHVGLRVAQDDQLEQLVGQLETWRGDQNVLKESLLCLVIETRKLHLQNPEPSSSRRSSWCPTCPSQTAWKWSVTSGRVNKNKKHKSEILQTWPPRRQVDLTR